MLIALLLAIGLAWWLHQRGELLPNLLRLLIGGGAALATIRLFETGKPLIAAAVGIAGILWWRFAGSRPAVRSKPDLAQARATLGLDASADAVAIRAAHRRLIAQVHPDKGGSTELAQQVTAARDVLLQQLVR